MCIVLFSHSGVAWAQSIAADFSKEVVAETFDNNQLQWEQNSNADKFCILSEGRYCIKRHNTETGEFYFNSLIPVFDNFDLTVEMALDAHSNKNQSAGVVFMADAGLSNLMVLEVNANKQYRLWSKRGDEKIYLSGGNEQGWEKSNLLRGGKAANTIEIKSDSGNYEVYFNNSPAFTFTDENFKNGTIGLYVAANTYVNFDSFTILKKAVPLQPVVKSADGMPKQNATPPNSSGLTDEQKLILLEKQVEELRRQLEACRAQKP